MPRRSSKRKSKRSSKRRFSFKRRGSKRSSFKQQKRMSRNQVVINPGHKMVIAPKAYVKFKTVIRGFMAVAAGAAGIQFQVAANRITNPFNTGATSLGTVANTTIMTGYNITVSPVGLNNWLGNITAPNTNVGFYGLYQVLHATTKFTMMAQTISDSMVIGVDIFNTGKTADQPANIANLELKPWSKTAMVNSSGANRGVNYVKLSVPMAKYIGLRPREYEVLAYSDQALADRGTFTGSLTQPPISQYNFIYFITSPDNAPPVATVEFAVENTYYVRFSQPNDNNLTLL